MCKDVRQLSKRGLTAIVLFWYDYNYALALEHPFSLGPVHNSRGDRLARVRLRLRWHISAYKWKSRSVDSIFHLHQFRPTGGYWQLSVQRAALTTRSTSLQSHARMQQKRGNVRACKTCALSSTVEATAAALFRPKGAHNRATESRGRRQGNPRRTFCGQLVAAAHIASDAAVTAVQSRVINSLLICSHNINGN